MPLTTCLTTNSVFVVLELATAQASFTVGASGQTMLCRLSTIHWVLRQGSVLGTPGKDGTVFPRTPALQCLGQQKNTKTGTGPGSVVDMRTLVGGGGYWLDTQRKISPLLNFMMRNKGSSAQGNCSAKSLVCSCVLEVW